MSESDSSEFDVPQDEEPVVRGTDQFNALYNQVNIKDNLVSD